MSAACGPATAVAARHPWHDGMRGTGEAMSVLSILVYVICGLTAALAFYYSARDLSADLVLLGACAAVLLIWLVQLAGLGLRDLGGADVTDPVLLYGYLLTGAVLPLGGGWIGVWERSRWGSLAIGAVALTLMVLELRVQQIWPGGFA